MTDVLAEFLLARIADDEAAARHVLRFTHEHTEHYRRPGATFDHWSVRRDEEDLIVEARLPGCRAVPVVSTHFLNGDMADHIARWDPARVLAECDAKRQIVEEAARLQDIPLALPEDMQFVGARTALMQACQLLALPYADHHEYREEWKP